MKKWKPPYAQAKERLLTTDTVAVEGAMLEDTRWPASLQNTKRQGENGIWRVMIAESGTHGTGRAPTLGKSERERFRGNTRPQGTAKGSIAHESGKLPCASSHAETSQNPSNIRGGAHMKTTSSIPLHDGAPLLQALGERVVGALGVDEGVLDPLLAAVRSWGSDGHVLVAVLLATEQAEGREDEVDDGELWGRRGWGCTG